MTEDHRRPIRSFVLRQGRISAAQARAHQDLFPRYGIPYTATPVVLADIFQRAAPTILEIGFGMGDASAEIAASHPQFNYLCVDVHTPGVGSLLKNIEKRGLTNVRIIQQDAVDVLRYMLARGALDGVHIFFPDPWPKKRHHKRRLVQPEFVDLLCARLKPGGYIHAATDSQDYAEHMLAVFSQHACLSNTAVGFAEKPDYRPMTKFEQRGLALSHQIWDLVFTNGKK